MTELAEAIRDVPIPIRMRKLPISDKGFPIPAFVCWLDPNGGGYLGEGAPGAVRDFRIINHEYLDRVFRLSRCWICGEPLGRFRVFAIGPMCAVNRVTMEPPNHRDCVEYAVRCCPFMVRPRMRRNAKDMPTAERHIPGLHVDRNPGAYCLYQTETYHRFKAAGGALIRLGVPQRVDWWMEARAATREEVLTAIDSGMPSLMKVARIEGEEAVAELKRGYDRALAWLPAERANVDP